MQQPRQQYGLGSIVKSVKKAVSGVAKGAKGLLKSDLVNCSFRLCGINTFGASTWYWRQRFLSNLPELFSGAVQGYKNLEGPKNF